MFNIYNFAIIVVGVVLVLFAIGGLVVLWKILLWPIVQSIKNSVAGKVQSVASKEENGAEQNKTDDDTWTWYNNDERFAPKEKNESIVWKDRSEK